MFKQKKLFPKKHELSILKEEARKNAAVITAYKNLQNCVKLRNLKYRNKAVGQVVGDAPLEYPLLEQQLDIKHKMRKVYKNMKLNRYLGDRDSDLNSYSSADGKDMQ